MNFKIQGINIKKRSGCINLITIFIRATKNPEKAVNELAIDKPIIFSGLKQRDCNKDNRLYGLVSISDLCNF